MKRNVAPGWFVRFVRSITCWQDDSSLIRRAYKQVGEDHLALARCRESHVYAVIGLAKLPPTIAGDSTAEAREAANFWMKYYSSYGFACLKCSNPKFDSFTFDQIEPGKANVYQVCSRCREQRLVAIRWIYNEIPAPISIDEVIEAYDILEGRNKKRKVKNMRGLQKLLNRKEKTKT